MAKSTLSKDEIIKEAILIVDGERNNWENAVCYITDKVAFKMRDLIRVLRKNYWGIFEDQSDTDDRIWIGLTMSTVEDVVKNIDMDQKDINFKARYPDGEAITEVTRGVTQLRLDKMNFGEKLDELERAMCIDGTEVWKTWGENKVKVASVDLLNFYIDPTAQSIQDAYRVTERSIMTPSEIASMSWMDNKGIKGAQNLNPNDASEPSAQNTTGNFVDVWEMWGKIPEYLITGKKKDTQEIDGHIIVSGLTSGETRVHLIEKNTNKDSEGNVIKPYEEARYAKIKGRWYGVGIAERLLALQEYLNIVVNVRKNKATISQMGLFKIRKGQGITPQMLANLPQNGAISVNQMDDIEPFQIPGPDASSYRDEEVIRAWAQRITQAFDITAGETLPASTTATVGAISNANAKNGFSMAKDAVAFFVTRWIDRHALPRWAKSVSVGEIVQISGDGLDDITEKVVAANSIKILDDMAKAGMYPSQMAHDEAIRQSSEIIKRRGTLFLKVVQDIIAKNVQTRVYMTNEKLDVPVTVQNLLTALQLAPEYKDDIIAEVYDLLGLRRPSKRATMEQMMMQGSAMKLPTESAQQLVTRASTMNG